MPPDRIGFPAGPIGSAVQMSRIWPRLNCSETTTGPYPASPSLNHPSQFSGPFFSSMKTKCLLLTVAIALAHATGYSYGPTGHALIGAVAEAQLKKTPAGKAALGRALALIADPADPAQSLSLRDAGPIPDNLRSWDDVSKRFGAANLLTKFPTVDTVPAAFDSVAHHMVDVGKDWPAHVRQDLWRYFAANAVPDEFEPKQPRHHVFHFADISVVSTNGSLYKEGKHGASPHDIVHAIAYCLKVLASESGTVSSALAPNINKTVALILLVHLVGDLHQPLHVGAAYFDANGRLVDGDTNPAALSDQGGNKVDYYNERFHGQFDSPYVTGSIARWATKYQLAKPVDLSVLASKLVAEQAAPGPGPIASGDVTATLIGWADGTIRLSQTVHAKLDYKPVTPPGSDDNFIVKATVKPPQQRADFTRFSTDLVTNEVQVAGARLAWLIETFVK